MSETKDKSNKLSLSIAVISLFGALVASIWHGVTPSTVSAIVASFFQLVLVSIVIWQACDPFADAAQYLGERWRIPSSVRGATLDAIASSLPELFTGLFFILMAVRAGSPDQLTVNGGGFGATIATCAGSAVYNMILIPAFCGLTIAATRLDRPKIQIDKRVILRDGVSFLICETVLVAFLFKSQLSWHLAVVLISLYMAYLAWLATDALRYRKARRAVVQRHRDQDDWTDDELRESLIAARIKPTPNLMERIGKELRESDSEESDDHESAGLLFNRFEVSLSGKTAIGLLIVSTMITAVACYWLVELTLAIADSLGAPVFFVAVIVAAAASSVPDTFLSIAAARRGDDDGAVSNAFGSNIFDICICLSIPLLAALWISGGEPITLQINGEQIPGLFGLQVLLLTLSVITLGILIHRLELTRAKSIVLVALYLFFIGYAVVGSIAS